MESRGRDLPLPETGVIVCMYENIECLKARSPLRASSVARFNHNLVSWLDAID